MTNAETFAEISKYAFTSFDMREYFTDAKKVFVDFQLTIAAKESKVHTLCYGKINCSMFNFKFPVTVTWLICPTWATVHVSSSSSLSVSVNFSSYNNG